MQGRVRTGERPRWSDLGSIESLVWSKWQGGARSPYQVSVNLIGPSFRCPYPSRKFPGKQGLALLPLGTRTAAPRQVGPRRDGRPATVFGRPRRRNEIGDRIGRQVAGRRAQPTSCCPSVRYSPASALAKP
ncbi:hypothetical protein GCM10017788_37680 [Amycolatopsis acidiphila]|nr:hypothetical protein GCM10017788_37680 [Amycolatopsis acidiphila]